MMPDSMDVEKKDGEAPADTGEAASPAELALKIKTLDNKIFTVTVDKDVRALFRKLLRPSCWSSSVQYCFV